MQAQQASGAPQAREARQAPLAQQVQQASGAPQAREARQAPAVPGTSNSSVMAFSNLSRSQDSEHPTGRKRPRDRWQTRLDSKVEEKTNMFEGALEVATGARVACRGNLLEQCDGCKAELEEAVIRTNKDSEGFISFQACEQEAVERRNALPLDTEGGLTEKERAWEIRIIAHEVGYNRGTVSKDEVEKSACCVII